MTLQPASASRYAVEKERKKMRELKKRNPASLPGQINFAEVEDREFQEKVKWKPWPKNIPENYREE